MSELKIKQLHKERDNWIDFIRFKLLEDTDYDSIAEAAEKVHELDNEIKRLSKDSD